MPKISCWCKKSSTSQPCLFIPPIYKVVYVHLKVVRDVWIINLVCLWTNPQTLNVVKCQFIPKKLGRLKRVHVKVNTSYIKWTWVGHPHLCSRFLQNIPKTFGPDPNPWKNEGLTAKALKILVSYILITLKWRLWVMVNPKPELIKGMLTEIPWLDHHLGWPRTQLVALSTPVHPTMPHPKDLNRVPQHQRETWASVFRTAARILDYRWGLLQTSFA